MSTADYSIPKWVRGTSGGQCRDGKHWQEAGWYGGSLGTMANSGASAMVREDKEAMVAEAYLVSAVRTPVGKANRGALRSTRPDDLAALVLQEALRRGGALPVSEIDDVILGCAMPEAEQGMNVARMAVLRAGLPDAVGAATVNRLCASGLEAIAIAAGRIRDGAPAVLAGGVESMSMIPMGGFKPAPNAWLLDHRPESYLSMGLTAERVAQQFEIKREEADAFALASHQKAIAAIDAGRFAAETVAVETRVPVEAAVAGSSAAAYWQEVRLDVDEGPRRDTSLEALAALKPAFHARGQVTAGNASQVSDGAAAVLLASDEVVKRYGLRPRARLVAYATAGVDPGVMGIGPVAAIPKALQRAGLKLDDIDVIELNEAFAAQALAVIRQAGLDPERVNVNGGAVALGHPLGCTGAKLTVSLLHEMERRGARYGLVTMCVGGGMGAAGVFERC